MARVSDRCLRRLNRFQLRARILPIEVGRRLNMALIAQICLLGPGVHVDDERHHVFECLALDDIPHAYDHGFQPLS